ncbi:MAG: hypothetical protein RI885_2689 [Actinomycetota bacterium]|jgi:hypothetical protein
MPTSVRRRGPARAAALLAAALVAAATLGAVTIGGEVAAAASSGPVVLVSDDGVTFTDRLAGGLFDGAGALVPGGRVSSTLWIKNPAPVAASLRVSVRGADVSSATFADAVALDAWNSVTGTTTSKSFADLRSCGVLMTAQDVPPGGVTRLEFAIVMDEQVDGATAQRESARFDLLVAMRDGSGGPLPASACEDVGVIVSSSGNGRAPSATRSALAFTGGLLPLGGIVSASLLVGAGAALLAARRRRADSTPAAGAGD